MSLATGTKLGPYEIQSQIGAGGMGVVYRANDIRLGRTVAIKVLPEGEYASEDMRRRFQREARVISGLSHPHICTIHDIGEEQGLQYIVMEYLEGETLANRLERGALPPMQVLQYGIEISDALEKAHRSGIIHRDLKPANVMLTKSGVKLLDFGLAKFSHAGAVNMATATVEMATEDSNITSVGTIVGTLQYMAPEQLEGKDCNPRTDIFAFGAVTYEMATGQRAFRGKSRASLMAAILTAEPQPLAQLQPLLPPALGAVVRACLSKEPDDRWQTAHDVRLQLEWIRDASSQAGLAPVVAKHRVNRERTAWTAAAFFLVVAALFLIGYLRRAPVAPRKVAFQVEPPPGYTIPADEAAELSPDGDRLAYTALDFKGRTSLLVRSLDSLSSRRLEGSESTSEYYSFVWTPDGGAVIAPLDGKLMRLSVAGGANDVLCDKFEGAPSTINRDGTMLAWFAPPTKIVSISGDDCASRPIYSPVEPGVGYGYPHFLPDGKHFLFAAIRKDKHHDVLVGSLDGAAPRIVVRNASYPKYIASGHVLFSRDGYLMGQAFDAKSMQSESEPFLVHPNQVNFLAAFGWAEFDASINGVLVAREQATPPSALRWYSREGKVLQTIGEPDNRESPRLSVRGNRAALFVANQRTHASDIWSVDLERGTWQRESFHERPGGEWSAWSPDGEQLAYSALIGSYEEMFLKKAGTRGNGLMLQTGLSGTKLVGDLSPDGRSIVYLFQDDTGNTIYGQSLDGGKPFFLTRTVPEQDEEAPRLSPDGRWVAYQSSESGFSEIYVRPFTADAAASVQVSSGGGHNPRWNRNGNEFFFRANDWRVISVPVIQGKQLRFGTPSTLFRLPQESQYDTLDGKRFLVNEPVGSTSEPLLIILNWKPEVEKKK